MATSRRAPRASARTFPVTVTQLPVVRCQACGQTVAHQKGEASQALTAHFLRHHTSDVADPD